MFCAGSVLPGGECYRIVTGRCIRTRTFSIGAALELSRDLPGFPSLDRVDYRPERESPSHEPIGTQLDAQAARVCYDTDCPFGIHLNLSIRAGNSVLYRAARAATRSQHKPSMAPAFK